MVAKVKKTVSVTTLRDYLDCRRAGRMREYWTSSDFQEALVFGSAIHAGLEVFYQNWPNIDLGLERGRDAITKYFTDDVIAGLGHRATNVMPQIDQIYTTVWAIFHNYVDHERVDPLIPEGAELLWVEKRLTAPAIEGTALSGQIDLAYLLNGKLTLVDHKTSGKGLDQASLDVDEQLTAYAYLAYHNTKILPDQIIYNVIMKSAPQPPIVLQSGKLSVAKDQATTPGLYRQAIADLNISPDPKYAEYIEYLEQVGWSRFFKREDTRRTQLELDHFGNYMKLKVRDVAESLYGPWELAYPAPSIYRCGYCQYLGPCKSMMAGEDWEAVLDSKFKKL